MLDRQLKYEFKDFATIYSLIYSLQGINVPITMLPVIFYLSWEINAPSRNTNSTCISEVTSKCLINVFKILSKSPITSTVLKKKENQCLENTGHFTSNIQEDGHILICKPSSWNTDRVLFRQVIGRNKNTWAAYKICKKWLTSRLLQCEGWIRHKLCPGG